MNHVSLGGLIPCFDWNEKRDIHRDTSFLFKTETGIDLFYSFPNICKNGFWLNSS